MFECTLIILGATGDLTRRKLIPALYKLIHENKLFKFLIVGVALEQTNASSILEKSKKFIKNRDPQTWKKLLSSFSYFSFDFYNDHDYIKLRDSIATLEGKHGLCGNRLFYLATMPEHFLVVTEKLAQHGIARQQTKKGKEHVWSRVVYEKPFGKNLRSARNINKAVDRVFREEQAYRIDHYLGKELIGNIAIVRFTNLFFQPLWNKTFIDSIQIIATEKIGIEGRGAFYDQYGVLKDVVQNHALQMLALIAMEPPLHLASEQIRDAKAKVLAKTKVEDLLIAQYEGYRQEHGVPQNSRTETFAALKFSVNNKRWNGVPFFVKAGKALKKETSIHVIFKQPECLLMHGCPVTSNCLSIRVEPEAGFFLELNAKVPDASFEITPVKMDFCHSCIFGPNTPSAYEVLLLDVLRGDQSAFVRFDEIEYSWKIADAAQRCKKELCSYKKGSHGPDELERFNNKHKIEWKA